MAASSYDGMALGMYYKPDISKERTFQNSALLSGLQKINKKFNYLNNDLYVPGTEKIEGLKQYKPWGRSSFRNRNLSRDSSRHSSIDSQERHERPTWRPNDVKRSRNKSRNNSGGKLDKRERKVENDS